MAEIFLHLLNMSITASWIVLAILLLRLIIPKMPKHIHCLLWGIVGLRLIFPFSIKSIFSLIPSTQTVPTDVITQNHFNINTGITQIDTSVNDYLGDHYYEGVTVPTDTGLTLMQILSIIWIVGMIAMLIYTIFSYVRLHQKVKVSMPYQENIYLCDTIQTPFILGIVRPRIYLPSNLSKELISHILAHENAHLTRKDHFYKPLGFFLLCIYWFNPIIWVAYILLCRDIELACDEKVVANMNADQKKAYSTTLLACSMNQHRLISVCPLAFGEIGVKTRVKSILNYKKPTFWIIITAVALCVVMAICFLTDPMEKKDKDELTITGKTWEISNVQNNLTAEIIGCNKEQQSMYPNAILVDLTLTAKDDNLTIENQIDNTSYQFDYIIQDQTKESIIYQLTSKQTGEESLAILSFTEYQHGIPEQTLILTLEGNVLTFTTGKDAEKSKENITNTDAASNDITSYELFQAFSSQEPTPPKLTLSLTNNRFSFECSTLSSHIALGTFEITEDKLILTTDDKKTTYQFDAVKPDADNTFGLRFMMLKFDAKNSSPIPEYRYSDQDKESFQPVEDGMIFELAHRDRNYADKNLLLGESIADIDGDGVKEQCTFHTDGSQDKFGFIFTAYQDGKQEYQDHFTADEIADFKLVATENGCQLHLVNIQKSETYAIYDIRIKDQHITLEKINPRSGCYPDQENC